MGVTIKKIAELCGVSRGTVDRVLNNRGNVKKETEEKVLRIARQLNYTPNMAARTLATRQKAITIGVVLPAEGNDFFDDLLKGVYQAQKELGDYGISIVVKTSKGYDVQAQLENIDSIAHNITALIIDPINDVLIEQRINRLVDEGIPVSTVNTDLEGSKRLFYVGSNYTKGGEIACGMLALITRGKANIGILSASEKHGGHIKRIRGFKQVCQERYPGFNVLAYDSTDDDEIQAYEATVKMLQEYPEMDALYIAGSGVYGACRAVIAQGREQNFNVICFDRVPGTIEMLERRLIKATICQQPYTQGNRAVHFMFNYLAGGVKPDKIQFIVKNEIRIAENI